MQLHSKDNHARLSQLRTVDDQVGRPEEQYLLADMLDGALFLDEDDLDDLRNLGDDSDDNDEDNIIDGEVDVGIGGMGDFDAGGAGVGQGVGGGYPGGPPVANGTYGQWFGGCGGRDSSHSLADWDATATAAA